MSNKPLICVIGGSLRNRADEYFFDNVVNLEGESQLYEYIERLGREKKISNSEGCAIAATFGALETDVDISYFRLNNHFSKNSKTRNLDKIYEVFRKADGVIFALPVYFADRSSLFHEFIRDLEKREIDLSEKVFGFLSVGAKRNGGQETTNLFAMHNMAELGGLVVGNGPPTSQLGGTAVGGNIGSMESDYFGIMTSQGTGLKVAETTKVLKKGKKNLAKNAKITFLILQEKDSMIQSYINSLIDDLNSENIDFNVINLNDYNIDRCCACDICPSGDEKANYKCIRNKDDMKLIHDRIVDNDGIILSGLCSKDTTNLESVYQKFIERTRYLRRDNFRLTNVLSASLSLNEVGTNDLFNIRSMASFIRHNTIFHKGIHNYYKEGDVIDGGAVPILKSFVNYCRRIKSGRENVRTKPPRYSLVGYK